MNITVIIPVHEFNDLIKEYLQSALDSVKNNVGFIPPVIVVYTHRAEEGGLLEFLSKYNSNQETVLPLKGVKNQGKSDFSSQINFGVNECQTEYFTILEYDDEVSTILFKNALKCIDVLKDVSMFLSVTVDVDAKSNQPVQIVNQTVWSNGYVGENGTLGYLDLKMLNEYSYYSIGGAIIKKSDFESSGGLKSNIKLAFVYEFLMRFINNGNKIYNMPKFGYKHLINRDGSLFNGYSASMSEKERQFWFTVAKKEYHFYNDRIIDTSSLVEKPLSLEEIPQ